MKVRLVLPALSLLLLLCSAISWATAEHTAAKKSLIHTDKQLLAQHKSDANSAKLTTFATFVQAVEEANGMKKSGVDPLGATTATSSFKEEFSYKDNSALRKSSAETTTAHRASVALGGFPLGLYYGFGLALLLLNGICYFLFEEKLFLYFGLAMLAFGSLFFANDGLVPLLGPWAVDTPTLTASLLLLGVGCMAVFAHYYLKAEEHFRSLKYISIGLLTLAAVFTLPNWISASQTLLGIANAALLTLLVNYLILGVAQFSRKNYAKLLVIAISIPLVFMVDYFVLQHLGVSVFKTEAIHLKLAFMAQALVLSYAIMYRMRALKEETEMRQTEMRIFLKRQEMMNRENVAKLMQDVYLENLIMQHDLDGLEIKLLQYISEGKDNEKIARKLKLTEEEIEELTKELYHKLEIGEQIKQDYRMVDQQPDYIYN